MGFGLYKVHNNTNRTLWYTASFCCNPFACCTTPDYKRLAAGQKAILFRAVTSQIHFTTSVSGFNVIAAGGMNDAAKPDDVELYHTPQKKGAYNLKVTLNANANALRVAETGTEWKPGGKEEVELK
jgi:hypothetical protein